MKTLTIAAFSLLMATGLQASPLFVERLADVGVFFISFLIQLLDIGSFSVVAAAIQLPVKFTDLLLFVPLLYLAILLPLSFNGIGIRESVFVIFASSWGISSADAVAFSLTVFALNLAGSLVGGLMYWFDRPTRDNGITKPEISG